MTTQECLFCASSERGGGALKPTGRMQTRLSRWNPGGTIQHYQRYQLRCVTCGRLWWFAGKWAAEKYQAWLSEHPDGVPEPIPEPEPKQDVIPQRSIPGTRVLQTSSGFTSAGELAKEWKRTAAGDHEDVA